MLLKNAKKNIIFKLTNFPFWSISKWTTKSTFLEKDFSQTFVLIWDLREVGKWFWSFFLNVHFWAPNWVGGAWYGILLIRQKPALRPRALRISLSYILTLVLIQIQNTFAPLQCNRLIPYLTGIICFITHVQSAPAINVYILELCLFFWNSPACDTDSTVLLLLIQSQLERANEY